MADEEKQPAAPAEPPAPAAPEPDKGSSTATLDAPKPVPQKPRPRNMPRWKVLLHNDDVNDMAHVTLAIIRVTALSKNEAIARMIEAHESGVALLVTTHRELAELYQEQLTSYGLTSTIEPE